MCKWWRWRQETKNSREDNEGIIHRDIIENEKETNQDTVEKAIEEFPDDTSPVDM